MKSNDESDDLQKKKKNQTSFDFSMLWRTQRVDGDVWMNIRCISTMQSGNAMHGPPEDAGKGIVRIKGNVEHSRMRDLGA